MAIVVTGGGLFLEGVATAGRVLVPTAVMLVGLATLLLLVFRAPMDSFVGGVGGGDRWLDWVTTGAGCDGGGGGESLTFEGILERSRSTDPGECSE